MQAQQRWTITNGIIATDLGDGDTSADVMDNGLIKELDGALEIRNALRTPFPEDSHAAACHVWVGYRVIS